MVIVSSSISSNYSHIFMRKTFIWKLFQIISNLVSYPGSVWFARWVSWVVAPPERWSVAWWSRAAGNHQPSGWMTPERPQSFPGGENVTSSTQCQLISFNGTDKNHFHYLLSSREYNKKIWTTVMQGRVRGGTDNTEGTRYLNYNFM